MTKKVLSFILAALLPLAVAAPASAAYPTYPSTWPVICQSTYGWIEQPQQPSPVTGAYINVFIHHTPAPGCPIPRTSDVFTLNFYFPDHGDVAAKIPFWPGEYHLTGMIPAGARASCVAVGDNIRLDCWGVAFAGGLGRLTGQISTTDLRVNMPVAFNPAMIIPGSPDCKTCFP